MFAAGASDRLRYQILYKNGGVYLDTDILPNLDISKFVVDNDEKIKNLSNIYNSLIILNKKLNSQFNIMEIFFNELFILSYFNILNKSSILVLEAKMKSILG